MMQREIFKCGWREYIVSASCQGKYWYIQTNKRIVEIILK